MTRKTSVTTKEPATRTPRVSKTNVTEIKDSVSLLNQIKLEFKCKNERQKQLINSIKDNDVTICAGPAGTGKSISSMYMAIKLLKDNGDIYKNIILLKSITQLKDEQLPSLPGDAMEKMYFQNLSFMDSLIQLIGKKNTDDLVLSGVISFDVIGSLRGRSLKNTLIVVDECQNITNSNMKTILTRLSENSKLILLGDPEQIDIKNINESSLSPLINKVKRNPTDGVAVIEFDEEDIVRHRLTKYFIGLYKEDQVKIIKPIKHNIVVKKKDSFSLFSKMILWVKTKFKI